MTLSKKRKNGSVVLVGRPNVGKSTLFNRVTGSRRAIVSTEPGTTRDVLRAPVEWLTETFELVDTGGVFGASNDPLQEEVASIGLKALDNADVVVLVVDVIDGLLPADKDLAGKVRRVGVPVVLAVNKVDNSKVEGRVGEFHALGINLVMAIAAEHGLGIGDLLDEVVSLLQGSGHHVKNLKSADSRDDLSVAIIGRQNVGKSSLVNVLVREERVLVSDLAGTTRDAIDTVIKWNGLQIRLVDTAGIRRPGKIASSGLVDEVSVALAKRAMQRADVSVVVMDASARIAKQDAAIAGEAERAGCGVVLAANKWDLVKMRGSDFAKEFDRDLRDALKFVEFAPIVHLSALTGERTTKLLETVYKVSRARATHVSTGELNRFLEQVTKRHPPASPGRREVKIQYGTQVGSKPPRFLIFTNIASSFHFSYERFLKNRLRETFNFVGTPIRLLVRARRVRSSRGS